MVFHPMCGTLSIGSPGARRQPHDATAQDAESGDGPLLVAFVEQDLEAEADAEVGPTGRDRSTQRVAQATLRQAAHEHAERALAGHDDLVGAMNDVGIARYDDVTACADQRALHRA
jgi:hypothetical protein